MLVTLTMPNYEVFLIYSNELQFGIEASFEGSMVFMVYCLQVVYLILYGSVFINSRNVRFAVVAILFRAIYYYMNASAVRPPTEQDARTAKITFAMNSLLILPVW